MPIRPEYRAFYNSPEWQAKRARILKRAKNKCEQCGKPNKQRVQTVTSPGLPVMFWLPPQEPRMYWRLENRLFPFWRNHHGKLQRFRPDKKSIRTIYVQISVAHVIPFDPKDPRTNDDTNLKAWCGWCHLHHDAPLHKENRCARKDATRPILGGTREVAPRRRKRKLKPRVVVISNRPDLPLFDGMEVAN